MGDTLEEELAGTDAAKEKKDEGVPLAVLLTAISAEEMSLKPPPYGGDYASPSVWASAAQEFYNAAGLPDRAREVCVRMPGNRD